MWRCRCDPEGGHAHSWSHNSGSWTRHLGYLRDQLATMSRWLEFWAEAEKADSRPRPRQDFRAQGPTLPLTQFEVHISHLSRSTTTPRTGKAASTVQPSNRPGESDSRRSMGADHYRLPGSSSLWQWSHPTDAEIRSSPKGGEARSAQGQNEPDLPACRSKVCSGALSDSAS